MKKNSLIRFTGAIAAAVILAAGMNSAGKALAAAPKNILFIFDASGSMKNKIQGKSKIDIAKEVMTGLVGDLPADSNVGLEVYGNKENAGCDSIHMLTAVQKLDVNGLRTSINSLKAGGKTPIAASLEKGADELKAFYGDKVLILVSDGEETCGGDPVKTAEKIKQKYGIDVVIHVVGFEVDEKTRQQLMGIAQAGGGTYYSADNASELKTSLTRIKEEVVEPKVEKKTEEVKPEPVKTEQPAQMFLDEFNGDALGADWTVINDDPEGRFVDKGILTLVAQKGDLAKETVRNIVLYKKETLPENYDVVVKFKADILHTYFPTIQYAGLVLYQDKDNYLLLFPGDFYDNLQIYFRKRSKGEDIPDVMLAPKKFVKADTYYLKIAKRKFKYTAFYGLQKDTTLEWKEVGSLTMLGKTLYPGLVTFRQEQAPEAAVEYDLFRIDEIK